MTQAFTIDVNRIQTMVLEFIQRDLGETGASGLEPDDDLFTSGFVDSVGIVRLIAHLEGELDVKVPPGELVPENFRTAGVMAAFMLGLRSA